MHREFIVSSWTVCHLTWAQLLLYKLSLHKDSLNRRTELENMNMQGDKHMLGLRLIKYCSPPSGGTLIACRRMLNMLPR